MNEPLPCELLSASHFYKRNETLMSLNYYIYTKEHNVFAMNMLRGNIYVC